MALRPLTENDLTRILAWRNAPAVRKNMFTSHVISNAEHADWFRKVSAMPGYCCFIHMNELQTPDGVVSFSDLDDIMKTASWGFYADPAATPGTGKKLGVEAIDMAFGELGLVRLNAEVLATNTRSLAFHEKLGFRNDGVVRQHLTAADGLVDVHGFHLLAEDWKQGLQEGQDGKR